MPFIDQIRYATSEIYKNYGRSNWWRNRITDRIIAPSHQRYGSSDGAIRVMGEDWDNLIVLDACRLDLFEETIDTDQFDEYQAVTSLGSRTDEWTIKNFHQQEFGDTVYVTGSPVTSKIISTEFHNLIEVWEDCFDEEKGAILPSSVADAARDEIGRAHV